MKTDEPTCGLVRDELVALLYGELSGAERERMEAHLATCPTCSAEFAAQSDTRALLDTWTPELSQGDPRALSRAIALRPRAPRRASALWALAAAVLAFLGLAAFGAELDYAAGRVTLRFALPWVPSGTAPERAQTWPGALADFEERVRAIAREETELSNASWTRSQVLQLDDLSQREAEERLRLVQAIDRVRELDRRALATALFGLQRGAALEDQFTRGALLELASLVSDERDL